MAEAYETPTLNQQRANRVYQLLEDALQEVQRMRHTSEAEHDKMKTLSNAIWDAQLKASQLM